MPKVAVTHNASSERTLASESPAVILAGACTPLDLPVTITK